MTLARFCHYIDGQFEDGTDSFEHRSFDRQALGDHAGRYEADVDRAVEAAHRAFHAPEWAGLTATQRGRLLHRLADLLAENAPARQARDGRHRQDHPRRDLSQIGYMADYYRYFAGLADKVEGAHLPIDKPDIEVYLRREPIGVVAAIVPWNSQLFLSAVKLGPALAAGLRSGAQGIRGRAGAAARVRAPGRRGWLQRDVVNVVTGFGEPCGRALTSHPARRTDRVHRRPGHRPPHRPQLGRQPRLHHARARRQIAGARVRRRRCRQRRERRGRRHLRGKRPGCVAGSRLLVQRGVRDLLERLVAKARAIRIGDPQDPATEMGPLATRRRLEWIEKVVGKSLGAGAELVTGGRQPSGFDTGFYYEPTILACPTARCRA